MNGLKINEALKKWGCSVLTPAFLGSLLSVFCIWVYLLRMGHQEIFLELATLSSVFVYLSVFFVVSALLYFFVFFGPSLLVSCLAFTNDKDSEVAKQFKRNIPSVFLLTTLLCSVFFIAHVMVSAYLLPERSWVKSIVSIMFFVVAFLTTCFISRVLNKNVFCNLRYRIEKKQAKKMNYLYSLVVFVGMLSYSAVFSLFFLNLGFAKEDSTLWQLFVVFTLLIIIIIFTSIPLFLFFGIEDNSGIMRKLFHVLRSVVIMSLLCSFFMPSIPVIIMNITFRSSGVIDITYHKYAVPFNNYPVEYFDGLDNDGSMSNNGKFYLFKGVKMFSFGSIRLICPAEISKVYLDSLKEHFMDSKSDDESRKKLQAVGVGCRRFKADELYDMGQITKPSSESKSQQ